MDASNQGQEGEKLPRHPDTLEVSSDSFGSFYSPPVPEATVPPTILDSFGSFGSFQGVEGAGQQEELHEAGSMDKIDLTARTGEDPSISPDVESFVEESRNNGLLEGTVGSMQTLSLDPSASLASRDDATPSASVPPTNATAPEGANLARRLSVTSSISSGSCRVSVSMPVMDSNAENLPTRAWTDPNLFLDIAAQDPVDTALNKAFPYQEFMSLPKRSLMTVEEALSMDGDPFVTLVKANSWVALANLAKHSLISCHPTQVEDIMKLWTIRLSSLYILGLFDVMDLELKKLGDLNALRYENFPFFWPSDSGKTGPMVPFHIKLLACLVPSLKEGGVKESISRLYQLLFECRKTRLRILRRKEKLEPVKWQSDLDVCRETQIKVQIANELYKLPDYVLALGVLESIHMADVREKALLDSLKGRLHLQLGDTGAAIRFFDQVEETLDNSVPKDAEILLTNKALLCICKGSWEMASTTLDELNTVAPSLISKANASLVHLYKGYAIEAVKTLEQVVFTNPEESARSSETLFNLSTLYDLLDQSPGRKKALLSQVISKQSGDTFKIECLKL